MIQHEDAIETEGVHAESEALYPAEPGLVDLLLQLNEWKWFIFKFVSAATALAVVISFLLPKIYTATARIMPPQQSQSSLASSMLGQLGPVGSLLGSNFGINRGVTDIYVYVLHSKTVGDALIDRFQLMSVYKDKMRVIAEADLKDNTRINSGPEGGISIAVEDRDPKRAADIANAYVEELEKLTRTLAVTEAARRRIFFEEQVQQASEDLSKAELAMKKTQEDTGVILLEPQSRAMIESLSSLQGRIAAKETQVQAMRTFATEENPALKTAQSELTALKVELARLESGQLGASIADMDVRKIPEKGLAYVRALREVKYREALLEAMAKQYELARVDEAKDASLIQVLDKATPPEIKSSPHRGLIVLLALFLSLFGAAGIALTIERVRANPVTMARLRMLNRMIPGKN